MLKQFLIHLLETDDYSSCSYEHSFNKIQTSIEVDDCLIRIFGYSYQTLMKEFTEYKQARENESNCTEVKQD